MQLVFAGFMCCTSIFCFLDHLGYVYFTDVNSHNFILNDTTSQLAQCQRYYVLAHASLVGGLTLANKPHVHPDYNFPGGLNHLLIPTGVLSTLLVLVLSRIPGLVQFSLMLKYVAVFTGCLALLKGFKIRNLNMAILGGAFFIYNLLSSTLTGYKEAVVVNVVVFLFIFLPHYKKTVITLSLPLICILFYILPTLATTIRSQVWNGNTSAEDARLDAYQVLVSTDPMSEVATTNWNFLTDRFSEIQMFTEYVRFVPFQHDYYGFEILQNSFTALIPRAIWDEKPNTEERSMQRVYDSGVINRLSGVSAKSRPVVDGYLSGGSFGIVVLMLLYGIVAQTICNKAEQYFGGYESGCILIFNGIFQQLWRGNNLEFLLNNVFYGCVLMILIFHLLRAFKILTPA
jgi:hypothetical protein